MEEETVPKLLALDVGEARVGIATGDRLGLTVRPMAVLERRSRRYDFDRIAECFCQAEADGVLCGLPLNMDGSEGEQAGRVRRWAERLARALRAILGRSVPILFWDERLSTYFAASGEGEPYWPDVGEDAVAAALILRSYLEAQKRGDRRDYGEIRLPDKTPNQDSQ